MKTITEIKARLNITDKTLERYINKNYLKVIIKQGKVYICEKSFEEFKNKGKMIGYQVV